MRKQLRPGSVLIRMICVGCDKINKRLHKNSIGLPEPALQFIQKLKFDLLDSTKRKQYKIVHLIKINLYSITK